MSLAGNLGVTETKTSGQKADQICYQLGFDNWIRIKAHVLNGDIWVSWKETVEVQVIKTNAQFIHMQIGKAGK